MLHSWAMTQTHTHTRKLKHRACMLRMHGHMGLAHAGVPVHGELTMKPPMNVCVCVCVCVCATLFGRGAGPRKGNNTVSPTKKDNNFMLQTDLSIRAASSDPHS